MSDAGAASLGKAQVAVLGAGAVLVAIGVVGTRVVEPRLVVLFDNLHWTSGYVCAAVVAALGVKRAQAETRSARRWFARGLSAYAVGQVLWDVQVATGWNPFPGPSDGFFIMLGPCLAAGVLVHVRGLTTAERWAAVFDVLSVFAIGVSWTSVLYMPHRGEADLLTTTTLVAYPVVLLGATGIAVVTTIAMCQRLTVGVVCFVLSLFANALLWMEWNERTLAGTLADGVLLNYGFSLVALVQGASAATWLAERARGDGAARAYYVASRSIPLVLVTSAALILTVPDGSTGPTQHIAVLGFVVVIALMLARQTLLLKERDVLLSAERRASESEERFARLAKNVAATMLMLELPSTRITYATPASRSLFGAVVEGEAFSHFFASEHVSALTAFSTRQSDEAELKYEIVRSSGERRWVRARHMIVEAEGALHGIAVLEDITDEVAQAARQARHEQQLSQAAKLEALGTLASGIAHDFNNLLMAVLGHTDLIELRGGQTAGTSDSAEAIRTAVDRGRNLVRRIMTFSRRVASEKSAIFVEEVAREALALLRAAVPSLIELNLHVEPGVPKVWADPTQLHQVLVNLVTNAVHAIGPRTGRIDIEVKKRNVAHGEYIGLSAGPHLELRVRDDGHGMDAETLEHVFEPFFTTKGPSEGTGLGLATTHGIVRDHQGFIDVTSTQGRGTEFQIILPSLSEPARSIQPEMRRASPPMTTGHSGCGEVLVVDDEPAIADVLREMLGTLGFTVHSFNNPLDAIAAIAVAPDRYVAVITDGQMPMMSGEQLAWRVRAIAPDLPIVLSSGARVPVDAAVFCALLSKPYQLSDLRRVMAQHALLHQEATG